MGFSSPWAVLESQPEASINNPASSCVTLSYPHLADGSVAVQGHPTSESQSEPRPLLLPTDLLEPEKMHHPLTQQLFQQCTPEN